MFSCPLSFFSVQRVRNLNAELFTNHCGCERRFLIKMYFVIHPTHECNQSFLLHTTNGESMLHCRSLRISFACVLNPFCRLIIQMLDVLQFAHHILSKAIPSTRCYDSAPSQDVDDSCVGCHYRNFLACSFILSLLTSA